MQTSILRIAAGSLALALVTAAAQQPQPAPSRGQVSEQIADSAADTRMASPEGTWKLYLASLRSGDLKTARACLVPTLHPLLDALAQGGPARLAAIADSFTGFAMLQDPGQGEMAEAMVTRAGKDGHKGKGGIVSFIKSGGVWKIEQM